MRHRTEASESTRGESPPSSIAAGRTPRSYEWEQHLFDVDQWTTDVARFNDLIDDGWWVIRVTKRMPHAESIARTTRALRERGWLGATAASS
ncbi:hypothetical protein [Agromyces ramosus]|uniref:hypothetical protein n=1 Tax=Agromyces ramosus TaxID=33879 RepID=UPI00102C4CF3|nr:hypothetical protein [Agromyces ramosus]